MGDAVRENKSLGEGLVVLYRQGRRVRDARDVPRTGFEVHKFIDGCNGGKRCIYHPYVWLDAVTSHYCAICCLCVKDSSRSLWCTVLI
jgi:hypothetical protein